MNNNVDYLSDKLETLILEIDSVCRENNIEYYLMEEALVAAIRGIPFPPKRKALSIALHGKDIRKFSQLVEHIPDRKLESLLNNADFPGFYMRYNDVNTLLYETERIKQQYEYCCIGINIYVLCPYQEKTGSFGKMLETLKEKWAESMAVNKSGLKLWCSALFSKFAKFDKRFAVMVNKKFDKAGLIEFYTADGKHFIFERDKFGKARNLTVGEHTFKVPRAMQIIGKSTNDGKLMFSNKNMVRALRMNYLVNLNVSGKSFAEEVKRKGLNQRKHIKKVNDYHEWSENDFKPIWDKRGKYLEYYYLTKERFSFYHELCDEKRENILTLYAQKEYDQLAEILDAYLDGIRAHNMKGFGLYFDKDMYVIAICTMAHLEVQKEKVKAVAKKKINRLKRIVDKIPQPYLKPLDAKDGECYSPEALESIRESIREEIELSTNRMLDEMF